MASRPVSMSPLRLRPDIYDPEKRRDVAGKVAAVMQKFNFSPRATETQNNQIMKWFILWGVKGVRPSSLEVQQVEEALFTKAQEPVDLFRKFLLFSGYAYTLNGLVELDQKTRIVTDILLNNDLDPDIVELPHHIRNANEAAELLRCNVAQIVKSLILRTEQTYRPILVLSSLVNHVDESKIADAMNEKVVLAEPDFVYETTGFRIGSIPAIGLRKQIDTFIDESLLEFDDVWAGAGTTYTVFCVNPAKLEKLTGGKVLQTQRIPEKLGI